MGRPKGGKNKYWSKEEKLKLVKEHLEQHVSTLEITTRENISNGMYNNWLKKYFEQGEVGLENKKKPGMVITIPANVKHWHGAKKDSWFSHIAVEVPGVETSNEWCEAVTDEEYDKLK